MEPISTFRLSPPRRRPSRARVGSILVVALLLVGATPANAHPGGRYGTADDMERTLHGNPNVLIAICHGFGSPRRRMPGYEQFQAYKHFHCYVVINTPYRQLCLTIHTLRNGRLLISRAVLMQ